MTDIVGMGVGQYFINPLMVGNTFLYFFFISILKVDLGYLESRKIIRIIKGKGPCHMMKT